VRLFRPVPAPVTPTVFVSYSRKDTVVVQRVIRDLEALRIESWVDTSQLEVGDKLSNIEQAIEQSTLVFAYITESYLESRWCMKELELALAAPRVLVAPFVDSEKTLERLSSELRDEVNFGVLNDGSGYDETISELSYKAWTSLQAAEQLVTASDHILASPAVFSTRGYSQTELMERAKQELVLAGSNLRNWLTEEASRAQLTALVAERQIRVTLVLGTYEALEAISPEGATHLRDSVLEIKDMLAELGPEKRKLMKVHFHVGVVTLSAVFVDPRSADGILFFSPRWAIQFVPHDRFSCVIDKRVNSVELYNAIYGGLTLMIQGDAKTLEQMLAER
jgi:hypothetical protein